MRGVGGERDPSPVVGMVPESGAGGFCHCGEEGRSPDVDGTEGPDLGGVRTMVFPQD